MQTYLLIKFDLLVLVHLHLFHTFTGMTLVFSPFEKS